MVVTNKRVRDRLRKSLPYLQVLKEGKPALQRALIKESPTHVIRTIEDSVHNILQARCKLSPHSRRRLGKYKDSIRKLGCPRTAIAQKRKLLIRPQSGGFLGILAGIISSLLLNHVLKSTSSSNTSSG